jgi:hypothetical protein
MKTISFPKEEWKAYQKRLNNDQCIITIRVSNEYGKYKKDETYKAPWGDDNLLVIEVNEMNIINDFPYYNELTKEKQAFLKNYRKLQWLKLIRIK